jgi:hypothetical protein
MFPTFKFPVLLVVFCMCMSGCASTANSMKDSIPLLKSFGQGEETQFKKPGSPSQKSPVINPLVEAFMETA